MGDIADPERAEGGNAIDVGDRALSPQNDEIALGGGGGIGLWIGEVPWESGQARTGDRNSGHASNGH